jgi:hypothetical protein
MNGRTVSTFKERTSQMKNLIDVSSLEGWTTATKTKNLIARPLCTLITDNSIMSKFMLSTLEGQQVLKEDAIVCVGIGNDIWQQSKKSLLGKYDVTDFTTDGWMICTPKVGNSVECIEITEELLKSLDLPTEHDIQPRYDNFTIKAQWGQPFVSGPDEYIQIGKTGDFICRPPEDRADVWIVARTMFQNTYETVSESASRIELKAPSANVIPLFKKVA